MTTATCSTTIAALLTVCVAASAAAADERPTKATSTVSAAGWPACSADAGAGSPFRFMSGRSFRGARAGGMYGQVFFAGGGASRVSVPSAASTPGGSNVASASGASGSGGKRPAPPAPPSGAPDTPVGDVPVGTLGSDPAGGVIGAIGGTAPAVTPEPATLLLVGAGLGGAIAYRRRHGKKVRGSSATGIVLLVIAAATLTACSGRPFQSFFSSGERYLAAGQYPEAVIQFENAARVDPASSAAQLKLGEGYVALHQPANAAAAYERACRLDATNPAACLEAASQLLGLQEYDRAAAQARVVLAADRYNLDAQLILASALAGVRRFADAEERVAAALAAAPDSARAYRTLGDVQRQRGDAASAEASFLKSLDLDASSVDARVALARVYFETERPVDAERQLRSALDAHPTDLEANRILASYLVQTNQCDEAESYWLNVAAQSPDGSGTIALADYYVASGRPDDALRVLEPLMAGRDHSSDATTRVAAILYDRGERTRAAQLVDDLLVGDPSDIDALLIKARMSLGDRDIANAREFAHRAAAMAPQAAAVREVLAAIGTDR